MGMFNWVDYECVCPQCKGKVEGFQTKDGDLQLYTVKPKDISNFYSCCNGCGCWVEITKKPSVNFEMVVSGKDDKELHRKDIKIKIRNKLEQEPS